MAQQDFQLNDNASFVFQYTNAVYKVTLNIEGGLIILEELKKYQKTRDIKQVVFIPKKETGTSIVAEEKHTDLTEGE